MATLTAQGSGFSGRHERVHAMLVDSHPADTAAALRDLPLAYQVSVFRVLNREQAGAVLAGMDDPSLLELVRALGESLTPQEASAVGRVPTKNLTAYDMYLRANWIATSGYDVRANAEAVRLLSGGGSPRPPVRPGARQPGAATPLRLLVLLGSVGSMPGAGPVLGRARGDARSRDPGDRPGVGLLLLHGASRLRAGAGRDSHRAPAAPAGPRRPLPRGLRGEIGLLKIVRLERYKGGMRVGFLCGGRALAHYQRVLRGAQTVGADLSVHVDQVPETVARLAADLKDTRRALEAAQER